LAVQLGKEKTIDELADDEPLVHEIFLYSGQKYASAELQKQYMRAQMWDHQEHAMWTYSPIYNTCAFEFVEEQIGRPGNVAARSDKQEIDFDDPKAVKKGKWQYPKASSTEERKKLTRDVSDYRKWELKEFPWAENEWHGLAVGAERRKPMNGKKVFEETRVPHLYEHNDRPFDTSLIERRVQPFGPKGMFETVHEAHAPYEKHIIEINRKQKEIRDKNRIGPDVFGFFDNDKTRNAVTTTDRYEPILKDIPTTKGNIFSQKFMPKTIRRKYGKHQILEPILKNPPSSIYIAENWDETAPYIEFQARMRNNDVDAPYNVATDLYISRHTDRDLPRYAPTLFTKRGFHVGSMGPAPWNHSQQSFEKNKTRKLKDPSCSMRNIKYDYEKRYVSNTDFSRYAKPPITYGREDFVEKNPERVPVSDLEISRHPITEKFTYSNSMRDLIKPK